MVDQTSQSNYYLRKGQKSVDGWLKPFSAQYIADLISLQKEMGLSGPCAEIGVHHGRLFILLHLACDAQSVAIDVFGDQHLNTDRSGRGNKNKFLKNIRAAGGDLSKVSIIQKSSLDVTPEEILAVGGPVTVFSVDGGHTAECALNDLRLAEASLHPKGVVILDDFFNEVWPEVCVGTVEYWTGGGRLKPFAITPNKVFLCDPDCNEMYRVTMRNRIGLHYEKDAILFGSPVSIAGMTPITLKRRLAVSPVGAPLKQLKYFIVKRWASAE